MRPMSTLLALLAVSARAAAGAAAAASADELAFPDASFKIPCAWPLVNSPSTSNVLAPSGNTTYWMTILLRGGPLQALLDEASVATGGRGLDIVGRFPASRYVSFEASSIGGDASDNVVSAVADYQLEPDVPGTNPAVTPGAAPGGTYRLRVVVNGTAAAEAARAANETVLVLPAAGTAAVVYRVYPPTPPAGPRGGVLLPSFVRRLGGGAGGGTDVKATLACPWTAKGGGGRLTAGLVDALISGTELPTIPDSPLPLFARPKSERLVPALGGLFAGLNNAYLAAFPSWATPGRLAIWTAPSSATFPPTQTGGDVPPPRDLRYWSLCLYKYASPLPLIQGGCANDIDLRPAGTAGRWAVVSGAPEDKPSDAALAAAGAVWVPGMDPGDTDRAAPVLAVFRNILPREGYAKAVQAVPADGKPLSAATVMGTTYPRGLYCAKAVFEAGGVGACLS